MSDTISVQDLSALLAQGKAKSLIDVRTPEEFAEYRLAGAQLEPLDTLEPQALGAKYQPTAADPIYILCKSGRRAGRAAEMFQAQGITSVVVVTGGTDACVEAGMPIQRG